MSDIKLTIDDREYLFEAERYDGVVTDAYGYKSPVIWLSGNRFVGKLIPKDLTEPQKNKVILVSYNELSRLFTEEEIYPYGNFTNKLKEFFKAKINP